MKHLFITCLIFSLGSFAAYADDPYPYDPGCRRYNATSETVVVDGLQPSKIVLCRFGFNSYIESRSIVNAGFGGGNWAVRAYAQSDGFPFPSQCYSEGAFLHRASDAKGRFYNLCVFGDRSIMEERTFANGPKSGFNTEMDFALGIY